MKKIERLVTLFRPDHYELELHLERLARRFHGRVVIHGTRSSASSPIKVHAKDLDITGVLINDLPCGFELGTNDEVTLIPSAQPINTSVRITFEFSGVISDSMHGLYPSYFERGGKKMELLATQLESHHAREIFPCLDEPSAKATFALTLNTENNVTVLGNMPIKQQHVRDDRLVTSFETSPRMSTYLLAFVVGKLHKASAHTKDDVEVNIWATHSQPLKNLAFALDVAVRSIEFFDDYFGTAYPLPKADYVAIPDFAGGVAAMENWGLMTFREDYMVVDPHATAVSTKQAAAVSIVHETSHQWFGNLVTMAWWDDLWLNESFATLMEYVALDSLFPDWNVWLDFASQDRLPALRRDSLPGVQAIKTDVAHPDEINTLFDGAIVYAKGGCVMHMLRAYIGEAAFRDGLKAYFAAHAYGNTVGADLWRALAGASGKDVVSFMTPWLEQSGFPVVTVADNGTKLTISQKQFIIGAKPSTKKLWPIPLFANNSAVPEVLETTKTSATYNGTSSLKLNLGDQAHFISHYSPTLLARLVRDITAGTLSPIDRLQLLNAATLLPKANLAPMADVVGLLKAYERETSQPVWDIMSVALSELRRFVETNPAAENNLKGLSQHLARNLYEKLGWVPAQDEREIITKLRATIISFMLYAEDESAIAAALENYHKTADIADISGELRSLVLGAAVKYSNETQVVDDLLAYHASTHSSDLRQDISQGLTATRDPLVATRLLSLLTNAEIIRPQDVAHWLVALLRNRFTRALAWEWLTREWPWIEQTFAGGTSYDAFPRYAAAYLNSRRELAAYQAFFEPLKNQPALTRAIEVGLAEIEGRVALLERDQAGVIAKLKQS